MFCFFDAEPAKGKRAIYMQHDDVYPITPAGATTAPGRSAIIHACQVSTVGLNIRSFFRGQFAFLRSHGFRYTVVTSEATREGLELPDETAYLSIPITRFVTPLTDLCSLWKLFRLFRRERFHLVQYTTPKAALLASIAAFLARVPVRLYLFWGAYHTGQRGVKRAVFKRLDRLACRLSTHVAFNGVDVRDFAISDGLCRSDNISVVGEGSTDGIALSEFDPSRYIEDGKNVRRKWNIPPEALVIGTVARVVGDKGINELVAAFNELSGERSDVYLIVVGEEEERDRPWPETCWLLHGHPRIIMAGLQSDVRPFYAAMDIFTLPTYREGFSTVNLEAAAMKLPVITSDAIGARESIEDGATGIVVPIKSVDELKQAITRLLDDPMLRDRLGDAGRQRIEQKFERTVFWNAVLRHREKLLVEAGLFSREGDHLVPRNHVP